MIRTLSQFLKVDQAEFKKRGVFDNFLDIDAKLFIDPLQLEGIDIPEFSGSRSNIEQYFKNILLLLSKTTEINDFAGKEVQKRLTFRELKGLSLGYGNSTNNGSGVGPELAKRLTERGLEITKMGIDDPRIFELIGLLENDFGADRLSDMTASIIQNEIYSFSERITKELEITQTYPYKNGMFKLAKHPDSNDPILFVPEKLLQPLPVASSWEEIGWAMAVNEKLRERLNTLIGGAWKDAKKADVSAWILEKPENIEALLSAYSSIEAKPYDYAEDPAGQVVWFSYGQKLVKEHPLNLVLPKEPTIEDLEVVVNAIIDQFTKLIQNNGANKLLYARGKVRHERYAQLLFYCVADSYCQVNNIDVSPEVNSGSGAVDFKFSKGYSLRTVVELKLSSNPNLVHGFNKQLPTYQDSEGTRSGTYLILRTTESKNQINEVIRMQRQVEAQGEVTPKLRIVDARLKPPASKRQRG